MSGALRAQPDQDQQKTLEVLGPAMMLSVFVLRPTWFLLNSMHEKYYCSGV